MKGIWDRWRVPSTSDPRPTGEDPLLTNAREELRGRIGIVNWVDWHFNLPKEIKEDDQQLLEYINHKLEDLDDQDEKQLQSELRRGL